MTYNADQTWDSLAQAAQRETRRTIQAIELGKQAYDEWLSFRNGRTDATIATALGKTEAEITDLRLAFKAMREIYDFADNVASPAQGDRLADMRKFS